MLRIAAPDSGERIAGLRDALASEQRDDGFAREGARLILVTLRHDSFEQDLDAQDFPEIESFTKAVAAAAGIRASYAGMPAIVEQDQRTTRSRLGLMTPMSLLLALALLAVLERRVLGLLAVATPMAAASITTLGIMGLSFGTLTLMESLFGVLVFGLGVDFALHLGFRAREERRAGASFETAVEAAYAHTGPGVVAGALTTAGSFGIVALAPEPSFAHLGAAGALGVLLCLAYILLALPASWAGLGARVPGESKVARVEGQRVGTPEPTEGLAGRRSKVQLVASLLLLVVAAVGLSRLSYERDLSRVVNRDLEALPAALRMHELFGVDPIPWVVEVDTVEEARTLGLQLERSSAFGRVESVERFFPPDIAERRVWLDHAHDRLEKLASSRPELDELHSPLLEASRERTPGFDSLPAGLRAELTSSEGGVLVFAFSPRPHMDARLAAREREVIRRLAPNSASMAVLFEHLLAADRPWMKGVVSAVLLFVGAVLLVDLRSWRWALLGLIPVIFGCLVSFGMLGWLGISLNTVTIMAAPLILGLGVDDGIHVVHRLRELGPGAERRGAASVAPAIALTTATTCTSFATLWFSGHPGLESMAWVMFLALPACLFASTALVPALAALLRGYLPVVGDTQGKAHQPVV
jgi:predicted RND superfamily exporter protein